MFWLDTVCYLNKDFRLVLLISQSFDPNLRWLLKWVQPLRFYTSVHLLSWPTNIITNMISKDDVLDFVLQVNKRGMLRNWINNIGWIFVSLMLACWVPRKPALIECVGDSSLIAPPPEQLGSWSLALKSLVGILEKFSRNRFALRPPSFNPSPFTLPLTTDFVLWKIKYTHDYYVCKNAFCYHKKSKQNQ